MKRFSYLGKFYFKMTYLCYLGNGSTVYQALTTEVWGMKFSRLYTVYINNYIVLE